MSKFTEYLKNNKTINEEIDDEDYEDIMELAVDFLSELNNNKEIKVAIKNLNSLIKTKYNELLNLKYKKNKKDVIENIEELLSDLNNEDNTIVDNAILNNFK